MRIIVIDDDQTGYVQSLIDIITYQSDKIQMDHLITSLDGVTSEQLLEEVRKGGFQIALVDQNMGAVSATEYARFLKSNGVVTITYSANNTEEHKLAGSEVRGKLKEILQANGVLLGGTLSFNKDEFSELVKTVLTLSTEIYDRENVEPNREFTEQWDFQ